MPDFIEHHYSRPTTPAGAGFDYTILEGVEIQNETDFSASAALGEADICKVVVDDPNAVWDFAGHRRWYLAEKAISSNTLVWTGYIGQQRVHRRNADTGSNITGTGRVWELDLVELNAILSFRIITGTDGNRLAETAGARLTWLLSSDYLSTVFDNGLVVYPTTAMDAVDYQGQTAADVLRDLSLTTGYNFFAYYDETVASDRRVSLFFDDSNASTAYTSFIRISNVLSDVEGSPNNTCAPLFDAVLLRDPTNVAAGVYLPYDGGAIYDYKLTTSYNFGFRDKAAPSSNVKTAAKAQELVNRLLDQHDEQDDKVSCSIILPASQLNDIKHGQRMQAKFTHLPAPYNEWTWYRVLSKSFSRPENGATDRYVVDLELSPQTPKPVGETLLIAYIATANRGDPVSDESANPWTKAYVSGNFSSASQFPGPGSSEGMELWYRTVQVGEGAGVLDIIGSNGVAAWVFEVAGIDKDNVSLATSGKDTVGALSSPTISASVGGTEHVLFGGYSLQKVDYGQETHITVTSGTSVVNANSRNVTPSGSCGTVADQAVPRNLVAYVTGTGTLTIGTTITCSGAIPDYNHFGRGYAAIKMPLVGTFSIVQSAFGYATGAGAPVSVDLPSPPGG